MTTTARAQAGYTLLEALVAFAILGIALAMLNQTVGDVLARSAENQAKGRATLLLQGFLARTGTEWPAVEGVLEQDEGEFHWRIEITAVGTSEDQLNWPVRPRAVSAAVWWGPIDRRRSISASTLKFGPPEGQT